MKYQFPENFGGVLQPAVLKQKAFLKVMVKVKIFGIFGIKKPEKFFNKSVQIRPHNFIKIPRRYSVNERNGT